MLNVFVVVDEGWLYNICRVLSLCLCSYVLDSHDFSYYYVICLTGWKSYG